MLSLDKKKEARALDIHRRAIVVDSHSDIIMAVMPEEPYIELTEGKAVPRKSFGEHLNSLKMGGVKCQIFPVWVSPLFIPAALSRAMQMVDVFHIQVKKHGDRIELCTTSSEVTDAVNKGKLAAILALEGGEALSESPGLLRIFHRLGVRSFGLTHNPRNQLADGSGEPRSRSGLTAIGAEIVEEMNRLNMIIDISHINERGFWDLLEISKNPVIASHSNCKALCDHHRNLTDDQIRALAEKGGVMAITFVEKFIDVNQERVNIERVLDHFDHAVDIAGSEHVGVGSDFYGLMPSKIKGLEDITKLPELTRGLVARGYDEKDIENILGENFLRIFKQILK
jgi:membrane dipeptidase